MTANNNNSDCSESEPAATVREKVKTRISLRPWLLAVDRVLVLRLRGDSVGPREFTSEQYSFPTRHPSSFGTSEIV